MKGKLALISIELRKQSPCPSVLLAQGFVANKTQGQGDCSYYNTTF